MSTPTDAELAVLADDRRRRALEESGVAGGWGEEVFDRTARLVRRLVDVPVALVSIVDDRRQCFVGMDGLGEPWATGRTTPLTHSFCRHVVVTAAPLVVTDARDDDRVSTNLAIRDLGVVAYLGVPVRSPDGVVLGSLCAIDHQPRAWTEDDVARLEDLAAVLGGEFALRAVADRARTFVARAGHLLRTPVAALQVQLAELMTREDTTVPLRRGLAAATRASDRVVEALEQVSTSMAVPSVAVDRRVDLRVVLGDLLARRDQLSGDDRVVGVLPDQPVPAAVTAGELSRVVDELLDLLLEHGQGTVTLSLDATPQVTRIRLDTAGALPPEVAAEVMRHDDNDAPAERSSPSLATRVAAGVGGRLVLPSSGRLTVDVVLRPAT